MFSESFPLFLLLRRAHEVGVVTVIEEVAEPDLEVLVGEAGLIGGEVVIAAERFPFATERPADASQIRSSFLATPKKILPTLSFLHL
jgi:hypothetical protein